MTQNNEAQTVRDRMEPIDLAAHPDHPVSEAIERMRGSGMRMLPVVDGDEIVGVLRMRDLERDADAADPEAAVRDQMNAEILYCYADDRIDAALGVMEKSGERECLVVDSEKRLVGHVSLAALQGEDGEVRGARVSDGDVAARKEHGGGRKRGDPPHEPWGFSDRPVIRD